MKYYSMRILLAVAFAILPLYESGAVSDLSTTGAESLNQVHPQQRQDVSGNSA